MPSCQALTCTSDAVVHWSRRPTAAELATIVTNETARRADITALADPANPPPDFPPLPSAADTLIAVYGCAAHGLNLTLAALVHSASCTAPSAALAPNCDCTPEPAPAPEPSSGAGNGDPVVTLPAGWQ